jgi:hypothetical protein
VTGIVLNKAILPERARHFASADQEFPGKKFRAAQCRLHQVQEWAQHRFGRSGRNLQQALVATQSVIPRQLSSHLVILDKTAWLSVAQIHEA